MKVLKWLGRIFILLLIGVSLWIYFGDYGYLVKGVRCTYLRGETSATIDDHSFFAQGKLSANRPNPHPFSKQYNQAPLDADLLKTLKDYQSVAFLVFKNDSLLQEHYWEDYGPNSLSNSFSMAKSVVVSAAELAVKNGFIESWSDPVIKYLPQLKGTYSKDLQVWHLATMCSGLDWTEHYTSPFSVTAKAYYTSELEALMLEQRIDKAPGQKFKYQSGNTQLLAMVIQSATGSSLSEFTGKYLWTPLGAEQDAYWSLDREEGLEKAYCCLNSNARDFARMGLMFLHQGFYNGQQILDSAFVRKSVEGLDLPQGKASHYGWGWWIVPHPELEVFYMRGILGQYVIVIPELDLVAVRLGHKRSMQVVGHHRKDLIEIVDALIKTYGS